MQTLEIGSSSHGQNITKFKRISFVVFALLTTIILVTSLLYYYSQKDQTEKNIYSNLSAVSHLKSSQIHDWMKERLADADVIEYNRLIIDEFRNYLSGGQSDSLKRSNILTWLTKRVSVYSYYSGVLLDSSKKTILWTDKFDGKLDSAKAEIIEKGSLSKDEYLSDIYSSGGKPEMLLIAPLWKNPSERSHSAGYVVFFIDPYSYLYPFIKAWPYASETGENFIVRKESDSVLFLSPLRFRDDTPLKFKAPLSDKELASAIAITSNDSLIKAVDYRNEKVFVYALRIPNSDWYIISKIDEEEVFRPLGQHSLFIFMFAVSFIGLSGFLILLVRKSMLAKLYKEQYESQLAKEAILKHFEILTKHANDNIFLVDDNENIVFANEKASDTYQYLNEELLGMAAKDLRSLKEKDGYSKLRAKLHGTDGIVYETEHTRKDGSVFPVEASTRAIVINNKSFYQSIVRDITERKNAEEALKISAKLLNERARDMERLHQAGLALNSTLDLSAIYENIFKVVKNSMECYVFAISSFNKEDKLIRYEFVINDGEKLDAASIPPIPLNPGEGGIQSRVIKTGKPELFLDYKAELDNCRKIIYVEGKKVSETAKDNSQLPATAIMVPIILNDEVVGLLQAFSFRKGAYNSDHLNFLEALSPQIAAATANARLFENAKKEIEERKKVEEALRNSELEIKERAREIGQLFRSGAILNSSLELPVIYENIFNIIKDTMECDDFIISSYDGDPKLIKCEYLYSKRSTFDSGTFPLIPLNPNGGIQSEVIISGKPKLIADYARESAKCKKIIYVSQDGEVDVAESLPDDSIIPQSAILAPILVNDKVTGTIQVQSYKKNAFNQNHLKFLGAISGQIAVATTNAGLYKKAKKEIEERVKAEDALNKSREEIRERALDVEQLYATGVMLSSSLELPVVYENTYRSIKKTMSCDSFVLSAYDSGNELITVKFIFRHDQLVDVSSIPPVPLNRQGDGIQSNVIISGKSRLMLNYREELESCKNQIFVHADGEFGSESPADYDVPESALFVPIIFNKNVIGVMQVLSFEKDAYTISHLKFLEALSPQIAAATVNARLYDQAMKEIEERKKAEEALQLTHFSIDNASDAIVWITESGEFTESNDAACNLFGVPKEMFAKLRIQDFDFIGADEEWKWFWNHVKENKSVLREDQISIGNGRSLTVEILANYIEFKEKEFLVIFGRDITERKRTEEQIRFQSSLLDIVEHTVIAADNVGKIIYWNKFAENMHGWKAEEVIGKNIGELLLDPECTEQAKGIGYSTINGLSWQGEIISKRKDGTLFQAYLTNTPVMDANGNLAGTVGAAVDITDRKLAEKALVESEKQHRELFEYANDAILVLDPETEEIFDANIKACEMYGVAKHELIGKSMKSFTLDVKKGEINNERLKTLGSVRNIESAHLTEDGGKVDVLYNASIIDYNGKPAILSINRDVTERKKQEEIIRQASEQLRLLYETSERLNKSLNLEETYDTIHSFISGIMDCDSMYLSSYNPDEKLISCLAGWSGEKKIDVSRFPKLPLEPEGHGTQSSVVLTGKSLLVNDLRKHIVNMKTKYFVNAEGNVVDEVPEDSEFKNCALMVPLKIDNSVIGVMQVFSRRKDAYNESNLQLLESIALHVSSSVNNARLYEKAQSEIAERKKAELELVINEERYRNLFESANDAILVLKPWTEEILDANQNACELYGFSKEEFLNKSMVELSVNPELGEEKIKELIEKGSVKNGRTKQRKSDGSVMDIIYNASLIEYNGEKVIITINRDDTLRKKSEEELLKLSTAVQQSPESIIITNLDGKIEYVNRGFIELTGYASEEVIGANPRMLQSGFTPFEIYKDMWDSILNGRVWYGELLNKKKNSDLYWQSVSITPIKNAENKITHYLSIQENITEKKAKDEKLRNSLKEKETMLKEIHHRVKNNLQIVSSLLKLQSQFLKNKDDILIFEDSQRRIRAMSLIHQNLYNSENLSSIDFGDYVKKLVRDLFASFNVPSAKVSYDIKIDGIFLDIETSIPCGLLINELVSNSLKYAFNGSGDSVVSISLDREDETGYKLMVGDNGKGIPADIDFRKTNSLGLQLVCSLTEQLEGTITLDNSHGAEFNIDFRSGRYVKRL